MNLLNTKKLKRQIRFRKNLLNFLLIYLKPTNKLVVSLSQNLDKYITKYHRLRNKKLKKRPLPSTANQILIAC